MLLPSGDQSAAGSFGRDAGHLARLAGQRSGGSIEVLHPDLRAATFARRLEQHALAVGREADAVFAGPLCGRQPPRFAAGDGTIHRCGVLVFASRLTSTALKATHLPSGETIGSPMRLSCIMSSKVKGCLAWACAKRENASRKRRCDVA